MSEDNSGVYDLSGSLRVNDVLLDAKGRIIDGYHRLGHDQNWRKRVSPEIDDDVKYHAAKIIANMNRRTPSSEELRAWINNLAKAIQDQKGDVANMTNYIHQITGLSKSAVRRHLNDKYKERAAPAETKPRAPKIPEKDTPEFNDKVQNMIATMLTQPVDAIKHKLMMSFNITEDEAFETIVAASQSSLKNAWNLIYDEQGNLRAKKTLPDEAKPPTSKEIPPAPIVYTPEVEMPPSEPVSRTVETKPPMEIKFESSLLYDRALKWYPESVMDELWDSVPSDSKRVAFFMNMFEECWKIAKKHENPTVIVNRVMKTV